ncbi:hypothetical protein [Streptomyces sp. SA15]|uniref:hypothetical protein n=1 Tax=Streptomyces sp. SA15 TaxID=934019 RepID=UPI00211BB2BC|nr:hypothetical protein [Streptomyces sp. SA15]
MAVWSHLCSREDLFVSVSISAGRLGLDLREGWTRRWRVSWRADGDAASCSVQEFVHEPALSGDPMRHFTWRRDQRHRPPCTVIDHGTMVSCMAGRISQSGYSVINP